MPTHGDSFLMPSFRKSVREGMRAIRQQENSAFLVDLFKYFYQLRKVFLAKATVAILSKCVFATSCVRRIKVNEVPGFNITKAGLVVTGPKINATQRGGATIEMRFRRDLSRPVPLRNIEFPKPIDPVDTVEAMPVQINEPRCPING
jgi:hypothetical protein